MKTKLLSLLMLLSVAATYAQTTASAAGIAIQGIARDNNNTARTSTNLTLKFTIYYNTNDIIYEIDKPVTTDAFGVFSVVIEPGNTNNIVIANTQAFLKIAEGSTIISDEKLKQVPYAIAASNGVPTGSIMPYIGATAPTGWVLCNGSALPSDASATALKALIGNNAPNLQGMFLRGTGISPVNSQAGPALKAMQSDEFEKHTHGIGNLGTSTAGAHTHDDGAYKYLLKQDGHSTENGTDDDGGQPNLSSAREMLDAGAHTHTITGTLDNAGTASETRPVNYGVNYIIKL